MMYTSIYCMFYDIWCLSNLILVVINSLMHRFMSKINKSSYLHATLFININICITFFYCCTENGKRWFEKPNKSHNVRKRLRITLQVTKNIDFFHCELKGVCKWVVSIKLEDCFYCILSLLSECSCPNCHSNTNFASSDFNTYKLSKVFLIHTMVSYGGMEIQLHPFSTSAEWSALVPGRLISTGTCPRYPLDIWLGEPQMPVDFIQD